MSHAPSASGLKRKLDPDVEQSASKKQCTAAAGVTTDVVAPPQSLQPLTSINRTLKDAPSEDGEVAEDVPAAHHPVFIASSNVPIRRPRRGRPSIEHFDNIHKTYMALGKILKYSGEKRMASMHPPSHRDYVPLLNPPHPNSPYHKYGQLMARLEAIDGLVDFAYSMWAKEYPFRTCSTERWLTISSFLSWCRHQWNMASLDEREKALLGLM